jgi:nucleotide-binding universal stress UspA family protein
VPTRQIFPLRSILCPVDFSRASRTPLHQAASLAALDRARLVVLFVAEPRVAEAAGAEFGADALDREMRGALDRFVRAVVADGGDSGEPELIVRSGPVAAQILAAARELEADLLVMGTHGHTGYRKLLFGSTTERVLRDTPVPVLVVPPAETEIVSIEPAGPAFHVGRVLAPVDLDAYEAADLEAAAAVARRFHAPLTVLYVVPSLPVIGWLSRWVETHTADRVREAERRLREIAATLGGPGRVDVMVRAGNPGDEIAAAAAELNVGLTVMALRGPRSPAGARPGAIAYRVLATAPSLVLALPPAAPGGTGDAAAAREG